MSLLYDEIKPDVTTNTAAQFQPYTVTSGTGTSGATVNAETGETNYITGLNPTLSAAQGATQAGYGQTQGAANQMMLNNQQSFNPTRFASDNQGMTGGMMGTNFTGPEFNMQQATNDYFQQGLGVLNPQFAQQNANLAQSLQGSGRGGLMLSSGAMGAGGGGMVNPDMYNTGAAQNNALANLYQQSRQSALGEQNQMYGQALNAETQRMNAGGQLFNQDLAAGQQNYNQNLGGFQANQGQLALYQQLANQQLQNSGMFADMEGNVFNQGLAGEQVRTGANADATTVTRGNQTPSMFNNVVGGFLQNENVQNSAIDGLSSLWDSYNESTPTSGEMIYNGNAYDNNGYGYPTQL